MAQVIVVGGGLAGLSAAHTLLERGANVLLLDKQPYVSYFLFLSLSPFRWGGVRRPSVDATVGCSSRLRQYGTYISFIHRSCMSLGSFEDTQTSSWQLLIHEHSPQRIDCCFFSILNLPLLSCILANAIHVSRFMGGNSTKATSGINGAGTQSQQDAGIQDSAKIFFEDTKKSVRIRGLCLFLARALTLFHC